jgi:DNA-binding beta-propeller fold protein YncE
VTGPNAGVAGVPLTFKATSEDPDGDSVAFMFDWGDTTTKVWSDFILSGETISASHTYVDSGNYAVKAKARNGELRESNWSDVRAVAVPVPSSGFPDSMAKAVQLAGQISSIRVSADGQFLYVAIDDADKVLVLRTSDCAVVDSVTVGRGPRRIVRSPDGRYVYVLVAGADSVAVVQTSSNSVTGRFLTDHDPYDIAVSTDGQHLYVLTRGGNDLMIVRADDYSVTARIPVDSTPYAVGVDPAGRFVYVTSSSESSVTKISTGTDSVLARLKLPSFGAGVAVSRDGAKVYVGCPGRGVLVFSTERDSLVSEVNVDGNPREITMTPTGSFALVANDDYGGLPVIRTDLDRTVALLKAGWSLWCADVTPDGRTVFAAHRTSSLFTFVQR